MADPQGFGSGTTGTGAHVKKSSPGLSGAWIIMIISGLLAASLFIVATNRASQRFDVLVAAKDIASGEIVNANSFTIARISADKATLSHLVLAEHQKAYYGYVSAATTKRGDPIIASQLRKTAAQNGLRAMSIPVQKDRAVNGDIAPGDRIDVLDATVTNTGGNTAAADKNGASSANAATPNGFVAYNLEVISVNVNTTSGLAGSSSFSITVALTTDQAAAVSRAIQNNRFDVVKSTGARQ